MPISTPLTAVQGNLFDEPTRNGDPNPQNQPGQNQPSGDGLPQAEIPDPPERPSLPRIDLSARQPPERNQQARNRQALTALLSAVGASIGAASDNPTMLNIGAGLSEGAARELDEREQQFRQRQQAFNEFLTNARQFNREQEAQETELGYERSLDAYNQRAEAIRDRAADRREDVLGQREHEREMEHQRLENQGRQQLERIEQAGSGGGSEMLEMDELVIPESPDQVQRQLGRVDARIEAMRRNRGEFQYEEYGPSGITTRTDEEFSERLNRLQQYKWLLQHELDQMGQGGGSSGGRRSRRRGGRERQGQRGRQRGTEDAPEFGPTTRKSNLLDQYDQVARQQGAEVAIDSIEADYRSGEISKAEAQSLLQQFVSKYGR